MIPEIPYYRALLLAMVATAAPLACHRPSPQKEPASAPTWQLLASELPSALLSVSGRSASEGVADTIPTAKPSNGGSSSMPTGSSGGCQMGSRPGGATAGIPFLVLLGLTALSRRRSSRTHRLG
jgi:MYXO-CTERM domain-containing protein